MPTIPEYREQVGASGPLGPGPQGDQGAAQIASLGRELAQDSQRRQAYAAHEEEETSLVAANDELQTARSTWLEQLDERKQKAPAGAADFTKTALADFDKDAKERIGRASTQKAREYLRERLDQVRLGIQEEAQNFERGSSQRQQVDTIDKGLNAARTAAEFRPQDFNEILAEQTIAIAGSGLTDEQRVAAAGAAQRSIASAAVQGMIRRNPQRALSLLNEEPIKAQDGSRAITNADGSVSTMLTATVEDDRLNGGKPTNIPTVWKGKKLTPNEAIEQALKSGRSFPAFESVDSAVDAAQAKSDAKGREIGPERMAINALDFDDRQHLRNAAEAEIRRLESERDSKLTEARQAMNDRLRDYAAAAALGIPITDTPDEGTLKLLYGDHEGSQRYQAVQRAVQLSGDVAKMNSLPTSELVKSAAAAQPKQVEGAADQSQLAGFVNNRTEAIIDAREKDGAGYLVKYAPATQEAWGKFITLAPNASPEERATATHGYLRAVRADRERLQIPGSDVLPNGYADAIADAINSSPTAEKLASTMQTEGQRWGSAWPQVYEQLAPKLSDTAAVIGSGIPRAAAVKLAATSQLSEAELKSLIPPGTKYKDVSDAVGSELEDFERSFPATGARTFNAFRSSAERLAARYMHEGSDKSDAVTKAYQDLIGGQYQMVEFRGTPMRVPTTMSGDDAERGAELALGQYSATNLDVKVPQGSPSPAEEYVSQLSSYVHDNAYWMTNASGTGIALYVDGGPVTAGGQKFERTWEQLRAITAADDMRIFVEGQKAASKRMLDR